MCNDCGPSKADVEHDGTKLANFRSIAMSEEGESPWVDPAVTAAISAGRSPTQIILLDCPGCGTAGYYNEGSHFYCRVCKRGWNCIAEDEDFPELGDYIILGDEYDLGSYDDEHDD